jgi:predicted nucleic acid-binding protein
VSLFVDTSALYAALDGRDERHQRAKTVLAELVEQEELVTHSYVIVETAALTQSRLGAAASRDLFRTIVPALNVALVDERLHESSVAAFLASDRRGASLVDWTSFEFMRRTGLRTAFAFDRDFADQGFEVIPAR